MTERIMCQNGRKGFSTRAADRVLDAVSRNAIDIARIDGQGEEIQVKESRRIEAVKEKVEHMRPLKVMKEVDVETEKKGLVELLDLPHTPLVPRFHARFGPSVWQNCASNVDVRETVQIRAG